MILDLKKLKSGGKESEKFYFEYFPERRFGDIPSVELVPPVKITGSVTLTGKHSAYTEGEAEFTLAGCCTGCLTDTEKTYTVDFAEEVSENNPDGYSVVNDKIDLKTIVDDAVLINFPIKFLCKEDCKGICAGCGANLNSEECKCEK